MSWLALALTPGVGPKRLKRVMEAADAPTPEAVARILGEAVADRYREVLESGRAEALCRQSQRLGLRALGPWDDAYPEGLFHLEDPPAPIFLKGTLPAWETAVALVGTRRASPWARAFARQLARALAEAGVAVVSGLARGIDRAAHEGAIEAGGRSVAVLGSAIDRIYPPEHRPLAEKSVLVSEFPPGEGPRPEYFPRRNRLIAALARAVVVVEAPERSGALITARHALELGREVFAVPGRPTDEASRGANLLIKDGAPPVLSPDELLDSLALRRQRKAVALEGDLARLYTALKTLGGALPDDLAAATGFSPDKVLGLLTQLELLDMVASAPGGRYQAL